jgi:hypothetical protein
MDDRGTKRTREDSDHRDERYNAEPPHYDAAADEDDVQVEVTTGEGKTVKMQLPPAATILMVKQEVERAQGIAPRDACIFVHDDAREEKLEDEETLRSLRRAKGVLVSMLLLVELADAQQVVPELAANADMVLGNGEAGYSGEQLNNPFGIAFVPANPDWVVTTEYGGHRVKIINTRTGSLICKLRKEEDEEEDEEEDGYEDRHAGSGMGEFNSPWGVAVTSDSSFVIVADYVNHRVQVLQLVVGAGGDSATLQCIRCLGSGEGRGNGELQYPCGVAMLRSDTNAQETVLVAEESNHRVSQFALDGTFIRIFAGTSIPGSGDGEFMGPTALAILGSSGEVAITDSDNHRIQIFDAKGKYKRQFGIEGKEHDGHFNYPVGLASDAHGNLLVTDYTTRLQVFSPAGKHLCTRADLGAKAGFRTDRGKAIAWSDAGGLATANGSKHVALLWGSAWAAV